VVVWSCTIREKPSREGVQGSWGKGDVGGVKPKEGLPNSVQLDSRQGWLSVSIDNYYLTI